MGQDLCVNNAVPKEDVLLRVLGPGHVESGGLVHCYRSENPPLYFSFGLEEDTPVPREVEWVHVGKEPWIVCTASGPAKGSIPYLKTKEGLEVGNTRDKAFQLYGRLPVYNETDMGGLRVIAFCPADPDCTVVETAISTKGGIVESVFISDAE